MIRIMADTSSDITQPQADAMGIDLVRMNVQFPGHDYRPEADEDFREFYRLLEACEQFPKTSQPAPEVFAKIYRDAQAKGDSVIGIMISSGLSGTLQSARVALENTGFKDAHLVDSQTAIMPQRILVEYAVKLRDAGKPFEEIVRRVESARDRVRVYGVLETLTYLYKGGRLSKTVALAGNLLHIKPVITARDGVIKLVGRARGYQALLAKLAEPPGFAPDFPVYFGYTAVDDTCKRLMKQALEQFPIRETGMFPIGGNVGAHVGPRGYAVAFVTAE